MAKKFLQEATVKKIQFYKQQSPEPLFEHANKDQVEQKYGGTAPDLVKYWPLRVPSDNYFLNKAEANCLVSKEEYVSLYTRRQLKGHKLNMEIIESQNFVNAEPILSPHQISARANISLAKDVTAPSSCESSALKTKRQSEGFPTPEHVSKVEVLSRPLEKVGLTGYIDECLYTESMEESNDFTVKVYKIREFQAYFLGKYLQYQKK